MRSPGARSRARRYWCRDLLRESRQQVPSGGPMLQIALAVDASDRAGIMDHTSPLHRPRLRVVKRAIGVIGAGDDQGREAKTLARGRGEVAGAFGEDLR